MNTITNQKPKNKMYCYMIRHESLFKGENFNCFASQFLFYTLHIVYEKKNSL